MQPADFPPAPLNTNIHGIFQSDLIIQSAIECALADLRRNPWLLDYVWSSLRQDLVTKGANGALDLNQAKAWFLKTNFPIRLNMAIDELVSPSIILSLISSEEVVSEASLGDINPEQSVEGNTETWPPLTKPFNARYEPSTGYVTIDKIDIPSDVGIFPGMFIVDRKGASFEILDVISDIQFAIAANVSPDFKGAVLKSHSPAWITTIESSSFKEAYKISCNAGPEAFKAILLHSVVVFCLLRYKQVLFEGRGFERMTFSSGDVGHIIHPDGAQTERIFCREIALNGYVRQYWPKLIQRAIDGVEVTPQIAGLKHMPDDPSQDAWVGTEDDPFGQN